MKLQFEEQQGQPCQEETQCQPDGGRADSHLIHQAITGFHGEAMVGIPQTLDTGAGTSRQ